MKTLWLAPGAHDHCADGTYSRPLRARNGTSFDAIFRENRGPARFMLKPGTYFTRGAWNFPDHSYALLGADCELVSEYGSLSTTIRLDPDPVLLVNNQPAAYFETLIAGRGTSQRIVFQGITLDCSNVFGLPTSGFHAYSSNVTVTDCVVTGVTGKWGGIEGFGVLINNSDTPFGDDGGHEVSKVRVPMTSADNYCNGIYVGAVSRGQPMRPSKVDLCLVTAEVSPDAGAQRAHTAYAANDNVQFSNCDGQGFERFFFCDTGNVGNITIRNCRGDFGYCAIDLPAPVGAQNPITYRRCVRIIDSHFTNLKPSSDHAIGVLVQDKSAAHDVVAIEDIDIDGCTFESPLTGSFYTVSIMGSLTKRVWVRNSRFPTGCHTHAGIYAPTPPWEVVFRDIPPGAAGSPDILDIAMQGFARKYPYGVSSSGGGMTEG